ncbi:uncharacterized protein UTRI_00066_B [Ustilago trichophora]|uniref:Secreted protein n=1 Tax=Ustilago trichophora TaxID=86804 RepID=A0A5C3DRU3_9BASI|nr:uncharacterized protein UTRI_00066_B [Ustilago trichophora]
MLIKITSALVIAAALLSSAHASMECTLSTTDSQIIEVNAFSAHDLATVSPSQNPADQRWATVSIQERNDYRAQHDITMRHYGHDCRDVSVSDHSICNGPDFDDQLGNTCAQVTHRTYRYGPGTGKSLDISASAPNSAVHFRAKLSPSLQNWRTGIPGTCAHQVVDAPDNGMKVMKIASEYGHGWPSVTVKLDQPDPEFPTTWSCIQSDDLSAPSQLSVHTEDQQTFTFSNIRFDYILYANNPSS